MKQEFTLWFLILTLFDDSKGKWFYDNGIMYEGEWKDDKKHGQGKKKGFTLLFINTNILWWC